MTEIETGNVTRYCQPAKLEDGRPTTSAFEKRPGENFLSFYLLEFFEKETEVENVRAAKIYMTTQTDYNFKPSGSFAVINIQKSKKYIFEEISSEILYREENLPHCGIFHNADDILVAKLLVECVQNNYLVKDITD